MPQNSIQWGQGAVNNTIGWGVGATNNTLGWGSVYINSYGHDETNLIGDLIAAEALAILDSEGIEVDNNCLAKTARKIYNPANKTPNRLYPVAYEILNANGVSIDVKCLSQTTKNLTNE